MLKETNENISNGWLKTGDLGKLDKQGNLYILGRKKELVIHQVAKIYQRY